MKREISFIEKSNNNYAVKHSNIYCYNITYYVKNIMLG